MVIFINPGLIDLGFILYIGFTVGWGYFMGGISEIFNILGLIVILAISMKTYDKLAAVLTDKFAIANIPAFILSFVIICGVIYIILKIIKYLIEKKIAQSETMTQANKTAGMFAGFIKGFIVALVISVGVVVMPLSEETRARLDQSNFISLARLLKPYALNLFGDKELFEAASQISIDPQSPAGAKMAQKMAASTEFQKIACHPTLQKFAQDEEIKKLVEKNDIMGLMSNKKFLDLMNDKEIMDILRTIDMKQLLKDLKSSGENDTMETGADAGADAKGVKNGPENVIPGLHDLLNSSGE